MHVYEAKNPYYAMIVAKDKDACADFYGEIVTNIECREDFMSEVTELPLTLAVDKLSKTVSEDNISSGIGIGLDEAHKQLAESISQKEPVLLVLDGDLL